jgi:hypothetical protein
MISIVAGLNREDEWSPSLGEMHKAGQNTSKRADPTRREALLLIRFWMKSPITFPLWQISAMTVA